MMYASARELLSQGISAAKSGDKDRARQLFAKAVQVDPNLTQAWWGLANVLDDDDQRRSCLRRVLALDPGHQQAKHILEAPPARTPLASDQAPTTHSRTSPHTPQAHESAASTRRPVKPKTVGLSSGMIVGLVLLGGVACVATAGVLAFSGVLDGLIGSQPTGLSVNPAPATLPPAWTPTPTFTPLPTASERAPAVVADAADAQQREVLELMDDQQFAEALPLLDEIIQREPGNPWAYYQRALSLLNLAQGNPSLSAYLDYSRKAIADSDQAIRLAGEPIGDYYSARSWGFENLSLVAENRVDQDRLAEVALENLRIAVALPHNDPYRERGIPMLLVQLGRCDEAQVEVDRLLQERGQDLAPSATLSYVQGITLLCLGEYQQALQRLNTAISIYPLCTYHYLVAAARYHKGDTDAALDKLNFIIGECPAFAGFRYYLRALIYHERGRDEDAVEDLLVGSLNTWSQAGLKAYVEGLMALDQGQRQRGVDLLKLAEMTIDRSHGPFVERIRRELVELGESPYAPTPDASPEATPIPALPEGHPRPPPVRRLKHTEASGEIDLAPGEEIHLHFLPPTGFAYSEVRVLRVHLQGEGSLGSPGLRLQVFVPTEKRWEEFDMMWDANSISPPDLFVALSGDVYMRLHNDGQEIVYLENVGVELIVQTVGGSVVKYSFLDR